MLMTFNRGGIGDSSRADSSVKVRPARNDQNDDGNGCDRFFKPLGTVRNSSPPSMRAITYLADRVPVFAITMTRSSESPLPWGEGARRAGEGRKPQVSSRGPHPAFGHPPLGRGPSLERVIVIANSTTEAAAGTCQSSMLSPSMRG